MLSFFLLPPPPAGNPQVQRPRALCSLSRCGGASTLSPLSTAAQVGTAKNFTETFQDEGQTDMLAALQSWKAIGLSLLTSVCHVCKSSSAQKDPPSRSRIHRLFPFSQQSTSPHCCCVQDSTVRSGPTTCPFSSGRRAMAPAKRPRATGAVLPQVPTHLTTSGGRRNRFFARLAYLRLCQ